MIENTHAKYATFNSDFLSATFDKTTGKLAFLGIESGGRDRDKHASFNVLLPGKGAVAPAFKKMKPASNEITDTSFTFTNENGEGYTAEFLNDKSFVWKIQGCDEKEVLSVNFSIKTAPPTIWTSKAPKKLKSRNPYTMFKTQFELPLYIHFPDFGRLEISSSSADIYCVEELQASKDFSGIELGYKNYGYSHNRMHALHYGSSFLTFKSRNPLKNAEITFKVLDECYPAFPYQDDPTYNGLKRNWLNSFALNRELFDMGDNIYFHGTAHLSTYMKSDLLQVMGGDEEQFKIIRRAFEKQIERSFKNSQAYDGEVSVSFFNKEKEKGFGCAVDSTPGAIISLTGIANWNLPFAKKLLPNAIKAADYLLSRDIDGDGIFETPFPGDYMFQPSEFGQQCNWWDNIAFGHKDIFFNCLCHRALRELADLLEALNRRSQAKKYREQLKKFDKIFFKTFYNPETTLMAGWVSRNGKQHDYMFTFAVSMAIDEGLIPEDEGRRMLLLLLDEMKKEGYKDLRYGIPGNVKPIAQEDTIDWPCMSDWGQYENGGLCGMNGFHFLTSMYKVGLEKEADEIFKAILNTYEKQFTHSGLMPGYVSSIDWRTKDGVPCGYNYLADNYYFLLAVYTGKCKMPHPAVVR